MPRSFISEFGLNMCANGSVLLQDDDLGNLDQTRPQGIPNLHIYVIGSRPRITLVPEGWEFHENDFKVVFRVHLQDSSIDLPLVSPHPPEGRLTRVESDWPHTVVNLFSGDTQILHVKSAILGAMSAEALPGIREHLDLEVLYVGQSFGEAGERDAATRLQSHSTFQKILSEASRLNPDREIWLAMFDFDESILISHDGTLGDDPVAASDDQGRIERFLGQGVSRQQKVNFTEAALIRHFAPRYNKQFRTSFPNPAHSTYAECYDIDLNMVSVELDTWDLRSRLYSASRPPAWRHFVSFPLHDPSERRYMLDHLFPNHSVGDSPEPASPTDEHE